MALTRSDTFDPKVPQWTKTVFRLRGLPNTIKTSEDVANLVHKRLASIPANSIRVFSLATSLKYWEIPPSKVATVMFSTVPRIVQDNPDKGEWNISPSPHIDLQENLTLDTHFMGMTPLNDASSSCHLYDCIAISGLASHPFGSWQPRGGDKTFMWIRDELSKDLRGVRAVIYGYDTKLYDSQSFQSISDLAHEFINQFQAYSWGMGSAKPKPLAFLAHSLGGLVLKETLVQLAKSSNETYKSLLGLVRGAVFFGVPNLGMEQAHFQAIVQNNPNEALIDDIARNSNYLRRLNEEFSRCSLSEHLQCFWAFETCESPTVVGTSNGIDRNGPLAILASRESATCRLIEKDPSATFPINATHSDMIKFTRESPNYHVVISKLRKIYPPQSQNELNKDDTSPARSEYRSSAHSNSHALHQESLGSNLTADLDTFTRVSGLTALEQSDFSCATFALVKDVICQIQTEQERKERLMHMKRLEPFLLSMEQFGNVAEEAKIFSNFSNAMAYVWGPLGYILRATSTLPEALNSLLDAYQDIGERIPDLQRYQSLFVSTSFFKDIVTIIYKDILWFHRETIRQLKQRQWKQLFEASWRDFTSTLELIKEILGQSKRLIENRASLSQFEDIQNLRAHQMRTSKREKQTQDELRREKVLQWLSPFDSEAEQDRHRDKRSVCKDPGRWLLNHNQFQKWFNPGFCLVPLLWLSGIPGAGKIILASVVVDEARRVSNSTVVFFYCKHNEEARNSFVAVARSILAQMLARHPHLLPYFHEQASMGGQVLTSTTIAKEMIQTALLGCEGIYVIIDGLDECDRESRVEIARHFREMVEGLPATDPTSVIRCLFVSQDDKIASDGFRNLPTIRVEDNNRKDVREFAAVWHRRIETKFGQLRSNDCHISNILSARAQGMFIFAELFAKYLESQFSRAALLNELDPHKLPVELDHVYDRILQRVLEAKSDHVVEPLKQVLGWIVCARRPLRWSETQAAFCIDLDNQCFDRNREISDSPKGLFASLVELQADGTIDLVHGTAREYLVRKKVISPLEVDYSLAMLSIAYLSFEEIDKGRSDEDIEKDLTSGIYTLYDYASACWAMHLQNGIQGLEPGDKLAHLQETVESFIDLHWSPTHKPLLDVKRTQSSLSLIQNSEQYDKITQSVGWAKKQSGKHGQGPTPDEALDLHLVTSKIRSVLERLHSHPPNLLKLTHLYGPNLFKCPRINCHYYHYGFPKAAQRDDHLNKHTRPFLCFIPSCHMALFGCVSLDELHTHLFTYHGIDLFPSSSSDLPFPSSSPKEAKKPTTDTPTSTGAFQCEVCLKTFTRNYNLKSHLRTHAGEKPFVCNTCPQRFTRKSDCDRHERVHADKKEFKFACAGLLKDGKTAWGCNASFGRADKLAAHMRSKKGQKCLRPLVLERLRDGNGGGDMAGNMFADQVGGGNADALLAAGKELPSFGDFLKFCGLDKEVVGLGGGVVMGEVAEDGGESLDDRLGSGSIGGSGTPLEGGDGVGSLFRGSISRSNTQLEGDDTQKGDGGASLFLGGVG